MSGVERSDLHAHTTASDGSLCPAALVREAKAAGLTAIAVTDHDTTAGFAEAEAEGRRLGIEVIRQGIDNKLTAMQGILANPRSQL